VKTNTAAAAPKPTFSHEMAEDDKTMPLGTGEMNEDAVLDPLAGAGEARRFRSGSFIIVIVVVIACGGLFFMRKLSHVAAATDTKNDMEKTIDTYLSGRKTVKGSQADPLAVLSASYVDKHVPLEAVKSNPFILPGEGEVETPIVPQASGETSEQAMARARANRQKDIDTAAGRLVVKSIIMSTNPLANISGTIVRVGDELDPEGSDVIFRVGAITADGITLIAEDLALGMHVEVPLSMRRDK